MKIEFSSTMVQFRRRHDNGRAFPIGNRPDAGMMNDLKKQDFNRLKAKVAKEIQATI